MQWNLGRGSLQPILARYAMKFQTAEAFARERDRLMPKFGARLFDHSCLALKIEPKCQAFLQTQYVGPQANLTQDFKEEVDRLFESSTMRQLQVDYFGRSLTTVLEDLGRVFQEEQPAAWQ